MTVHRTVFCLLTLGFGWIWLCHNVISEIVNNIKESVKLLSSQRQMGAGASAGGEWLKNKGPGSSYLTCFAAEPSGWSLCFVSSTHFAHCFSDLLLQQLLTLLCPCVRTQWLSAFCSFLAGSLWLPRQSLKFWRPARLRQPVGLGLNAAINSPSALNALWNFPVFVL